MKVQELQSELISDSYHDVRVVVDDKEYKIGSLYGIELVCNRVTGWKLFGNIADKNPTTLGGEFNRNRFKIYFGDILVFDNKYIPSEDDESDD